MPALPWTQRRTVDPGRTYLAMASRLPLRRRRSIPGFLRDAMAIRRQLARADGMVGYALDAELARKTFWTFSVWEEQASLDAFAASDPHRAATAAVPAFAGHQPDSGLPGGRQGAGVIDGVSDPADREDRQRGGG
jgi:quinol monooxygenase YgiN